ncbi:MAG: hypothetical protein E5W21_23485, partial [Mesorhizobium sp.]
MIVRPRPTFLQLFFIMRGSVVPRILPQIFGFAIYSAVILVVARWFQLDLGVFNITPFGLVGVTLSIYLSFRNNAAYDRWWEARKLWGALVFEIRNLARATTSLIPDRTEQRALLMEALAFCHFLRGQLRRIDSVKDVRAFVEAEAETAARFANPADEMVRR